MTLQDAETRNSIFTPAEIDYLKNQPLCRIATVGSNDQPHVTPVGYRYNQENDTFDIGGIGGFRTRKRWRDVEQNPHVAFVIDDIASYEPWQVRGIEIRGTVQLMESGGETIFPGANPEMFRITPKRVVSWGIDTDAYGAANARSVNEQDKQPHSL